MPAHRFPLIVPVAFVLALGEDPASIGWMPGLVALLLLVAVIGVLAPLTRLQIGIARCEPHAVMVTMAWLPVLTFAAEGLSPAHAWSWPTAVGIAIVTGFLLPDRAERRR